MEDATGATCEDLHYELIETETSYELHKIIDEKGLKWLETAVYPVTIGPTMGTIEDLWTESGFKTSSQFVRVYPTPVKVVNGGLIDASPYSIAVGQYVNPANSHQ